MFSIKIDDIDPFLDATILFAELTHDEICLKFLPSTMSIIVRYECPIFFVTMSLPQPLFVEYSVDRNHISRISLLSFYSALLECQTSAALNIHLQEDQNKILLTFEPSSKYIYTHIFIMPSFLCFFYSKLNFGSQYFLDSLIHTF